MIDAICRVSPPPRTALSIAIAGALAALSIALPPAGEAAAAERPASGCSSVNGWRQAAGRSPKGCGWAQRLCSASRLIYRPAR